MSVLKQPRKINRTTLVLLGVAAVACGLAVTLLVARQESIPAPTPAPTPLSSTSNAAQKPAYTTTALRMGNETYTLQVANTPEQQALGLGGRDSLALKAGMLFSYPQPIEQSCFWMKDMRFTIDIIWLDSEKQVIKIESNLSPATYPQNYCSDKASQYVVELSAGQAAKLDMAIGQKLDF